LNDKKITDEMKERFATTDKEIDEMLLELKEVIFSI
jgi:hypothetical protein